MSTAPIVPLKTICHDSDGLPLLLCGAFYLYERLENMGADC